MPNYLKGIEEYSTKELILELVMREGIEQLTVAPYSEFVINIDKDWNDESESWNDEGSARILIVKD